MIKTRMNTIGIENVVKNCTNLVQDVSLNNKNKLYNVDYLAKIFKKNLKINFEVSNLIPFDVMDVFDDRIQKPMIIIHNTSSMEAREFAYLHGLAHLLLHWKWLSKDTSLNNLKTMQAQKYLCACGNNHGLNPNSLIEREADYFAQRFLKVLKLSMIEPKDL